MQCLLKSAVNKVHGIENFLECYLKGKEFKFDRYTSYNPAVTEFPKHQDEIIAILAETYENRAADVQMYMKAAYQNCFRLTCGKENIPSAAIC